MHNLRKTKKMKIPIIDYNPEQSASENLIEISTRIQPEGQLIEADLFAQKLSPRNQQKQMLDPLPIHFQKKTARPYTQTSSRQNTSMTQRSSFKRQRNCKTDIDRTRFSLSTIKLVYVDIKPTERKFYCTKQRIRELVHCKNSDSTFLTFKTSKSAQKCEKLKKRLAQGVNKQIVSAFQIKNIKLQNRYESYIHQFKNLKA